MNALNARLLSRKFILALLSLISCSLLVYLGKIDAGVYSTIMVATIGAYLTANVMQKNVEKDQTDEK